MRSRALPILATLVALLIPSAAQAGRVESRPDLERLFTQAGTTGTFVVHQSGRGPDRTVVVGDRRSRTRYLPSSTFKIPNSLIAIQTGVASGPAQPYPGPNPNYLLDGAPLLPAACEGDLTLQTAFTNSCIPIYQRIARAVGPRRYAVAVRALRYGNRDTTGAPVDEFWLRGSFAISAREQVGFLERLRTGRLPASARAQADVRELLVTQRGDGTVKRGKTGYVFSTPQRLGWWVGWVEHAGRTSTFALNLDVDAPADLALRTQIGEALLTELGAYR